MTVQEIKAAVCGRDENGKSKIVSMIGAHIYNTENLTKEPEVIMEAVSMEPAAELRVHGNFATIDLEFNNETSEHLSSYFRCLERYLEETENNTESREASLFLSLVPFELSGQYYITAVNPVFWSVSPDFIGGSNRKIRIVFYADDVMFNESDLEENILDALMLQTESEEKDEEDSELYNYIDETDTIKEEYYDDEKAERNKMFGNADKYRSEIQRQDNHDDDDPYAE